MMYKKNKKERKIINSLRTLNSFWLISSSCWITYFHASIPNWIKTNLKELCIGSRYEYLTNLYYLLKWSIQSVRKKGKQKVCMHWIFYRCYLHVAGSDIFPCVHCNNRIPNWVTANHWRVVGFQYVYLINY